MHIESRSQACNATRIAGDAPTISFVRWTKGTERGESWAIFSHNLSGTGDGGGSFHPPRLNIHTVTPGAVARARARAPETRRKGCLVKTTDENSRGKIKSGRRDVVHRETRSGTFDVRLYDLDAFQCRRSLT